MMRILAIDASERFFDLKHSSNTTEHCGPCPREKRMVFEKIRKNCRNLIITNRKQYGKNSIESFWGRV